MTREEAARRFAEVMGGGLVGNPDEPNALYITLDVVSAILVPAPSAPLHEHLTFVGRVAEAVGAEGGIVDWNALTGEGHVALEMWKRGKDAPDLSHAALLAAIAAKEGAK